MVATDVSKKGGRGVWKEGHIASPGAMRIQDGCGGYQ